MNFILRGSNSSFAEILTMIRAATSTLTLFSGMCAQQDPPYLKLQTYEYEIDSPRVSSSVSFHEQPFVEDGTRPVLWVGRQTRGRIAHKPLRHVHVVAEERPTHQDLLSVQSTWLREISSSLVRSLGISVIPVAVLFPSIRMHFSDFTWKISRS